MTLTIESGIDVFGAIEGIHEAQDHCFMNFLQPHVVGCDISDKLLHRMSLTSLGMQDDGNDLGKRYDPLYNFI